VNIFHSPTEMPRAERSVAIGSFDGVHFGHRLVLDSASGMGLRSTAITFWPHPRTVLGNRVPLLTTLDRRLELLADAGVDETLVVGFDDNVARLEPDEFADSFLRTIGTEVIAVGENFRFGRGASGDVETLRSLGFDVRAVPLSGGISSSAIRRLVAAGDVRAAARLLGRPAEVEGIVVLGDQRGGTLGYPTANLDVPRDLLVPAFGIYAGAALDRRAAISIGVNPHYGGDELRIEPYLLDYDGDLYGKRLVVELWERLREERAFPSEEALVAQIAADVEATRTATRPV
jgi:riboflavin kinase / FMN adenylyltransferase